MNSNRPHNTTAIFRRRVNIMSVFGMYMQQTPDYTLLINTLSKLIKIPRTRRKILQYTTIISKNM